MSRLRRRSASVLILGALLLPLAAGSALASLSLGEAHVLVAGGDRTERPAISPDGTRIAFVSDRGGTENLWVANLDGGEPTQLTHETRANIQVGNPRWSPRGDFLVYTSNKGQTGSFDLWIISLDGQHDEALTHEPSLDWMPAWSPDGKRIAFVSDRQQADALYVINVDGSGLTKVADLAYEPAWSPDGKQLAAYHIRGEAEGVHLFPLDPPGNPKLVLPGGRMPTFSPDGRYLLAVKSDEAGERLWLVDLQHDTNCAFGPATPGLAWPSWGARGPEIAYEATSGGKRQVLVAPLVESRPVSAILEPAAGAQVRGAVSVKGRVGGEGLKITAWRLEVGPGTNPKSWSTVAEGSGPADGELSSWRTAGLEGVYTIRLTAVSDSGETSVSAVPVTIFGQYGVVWDRHTIPTAMSVNGLYEAEIRLRNIGTMTWRTDGQFAVYGSYQWIDQDGRVVVAEGLRSDLPNDVGAEEAAVLTAKIVAPSVGGTYTLRYDLRQGGQVWFNELGSKPLDLTVTVAVPYAAQVSLPSPPTVVVPGQIYTVEVRAHNVGAVGWHGLAGSTAAAPDTVLLVPHWQDVAGGLVDTPPILTPLPQNIGPGESISVMAKVRAPAVNGNYRLSFDLRDDKGSYSERSGIRPENVVITVASPYGVTFLDHTTAGRMFPGDIQSVNIQVRNTGSIKWRSDGPQPIRVTYTWLDRTGARVPVSPIETDLPYDVLPGQVASLTARLQAPGEPGEYTLVWDLTQLGGKRFSELGNLPLQVPVMVGAPTHAVRWEQLQHPTNMVVGSMYTVELRMTNTGAMTWDAEGKDGVKLGYHWVRPNGDELARAPLFTDLPSKVDQGQSVKVTARVQAPDRPGQYLLRWDLYQGGYDWFSTRGAATLDIPVRVEVIYGAQYLSHDTPTRLVAGQRYRVNLRIRNTGTIPWECGGTVPVTLSYRWYNASGDEVTGQQAIRSTLSRNVQPGESVEISAYLIAPTQAGRYDLEWDMLFANSFWFSEKGVTPLRVPVVVE